MNLYRVQDWYYGNGRKAQVMYIYAENPRKARELFVEINPDMRDLRVCYVNPEIYFTDQAPQEWHGSVRGYTAWMDLDYFGGINIDLDAAVFIPFRTRKEKIRALFS